MRIGIDCRTILHEKGEQAGVGHYTLFLVRALLKHDKEHTYILFFSSKMSKHDARVLVGAGKNVCVRFFPAPIFPFYSTHVRYARFIAQEHCNIFFSPSGHMPYFYRGVSVITIHDLAILHHPEWFPESTFERFIATKILLAHAIARAQRIVVPSATTAEDVKKFYKVSQEKIQVIPLASTLSEQGKSGHLKEKIQHPYLLFVGTIEPRKNLVKVLRAFRAMGNEKIQLIIAGKRGWKDQEIVAELKKIPRAAYLGYVSAEEKHWLMEHAIAFVFPSLYEGFGMPVLEAMSVGTPVITSFVGSLSEVVADAGLLVDPHDEHALKVAMEQMIQGNGVRERLAKAGRERSILFSWERVAQEMTQVFHEIRG